MLDQARIMGDGRTRPHVQEAGDDHAAEEDR